MSHESSPKRVLTDSIRVGIFCRRIGMMLFPIQEDIHDLSTDTPERRNATPGRIDRNDTVPLNW